MFLLQTRGAPLDVDGLRAELERLGEFVLVAGDTRAVKVHVHNDRPDRIISLGLAMGSLTGITVENLDTQSRGVRERREAEAIAGVAASGAGAAGVARGTASGRARARPVRKRRPSRLSITSSSATPGTSTPDPTSRPRRLA